ncbi:hypothetical protein C2R60_05970 [Helicobacter pylori]|nr:hypothetical protein C2R60_05970 [Helicobacter pylori]
MFYLMMRFILIYLKLYLFKALSIQSFIYLRLYLFKALFLLPISNHSPIISNNFYPFLPNSKIPFQTLKFLSNSQFSFKL